MKKLSGDSPIRIIVVAFAVIFFVALFVWQIERYLNVSKDSKLQAQITKMNLLIEADSLEASTKSRFAYLHSNQDISEPWPVLDKKLNFKPQDTLARLFVRNHFSASPPHHESCYVYLYFPPKRAQKLDFYQSDKPAYLLAGWSHHQNKAIVAGTPQLTAWGVETLKEKHFACTPKALRPNLVAVMADGMEIDLPGYDFQFADLYYSKVKQ